MRLPVVERTVAAAPSTISDMYRSHGVGAQVPVAWLAKISYWLFSELSPAAVYKRKRAEAEQTKKVKAQ